MVIKLESQIKHTIECDVVSINGCRKCHVGGFQAVKIVRVDDVNVIESDLVRRGGNSGSFSIRVTGRQRRHGESTSESDSNFIVGVGLAGVSSSIANYYYWAMSVDCGNLLDIGSSVHEDHLSGGVIRERGECISEIAVRATNRYRLTNQDGTSRGSSTAR